MDDVFAVAVTEPVADVAGVGSCDAVDFRRAILGNAACDDVQHASIAVRDDFDHVATLEHAVRTNDAHGQQRCPLVRDGVRGAGIDMDMARHRRHVPQPVFARMQPGGAGMQQRAAQLATRKQAHHFAVAAVEQHGLDPRGRGFLRRLQLGTHAARTHGRSGAACHRHDFGSEFEHFVDRLGIEIRARIGRIQAIDIGGDQQQVGVDQCRHDGREIVVVAQGELVDGHGVVLVHHGHDLVVEQLAQRGARVEVAAPVAQVVMGQQHLRQRMVEQALPQRHGLRLAQRRHGLAGGVAGVFVGMVAQHQAAGGDGARRHQHDLATVGVAG